MMEKDEIEIRLEKLRAGTVDVNQYAVKIENKVQTIENYVEKYAPLQNLR